MSVRLACKGHRNLRYSSEIPIIQILNSATLFKLLEVNLTALSNLQKNPHNTESLS